MKRTSLQSKIPPAIREQLAEDEYMKTCRINNALCEGRIEWHHAFTYAGKRQNHLWSLISLCHYHHMHEGRSRRIIEDRLRARIKHFNAEEQFKIDYPKSNLFSV